MTADLSSTGEIRFSGRYQQPRTKTHAAVSVIIHVELVDISKAQLLMNETSGAVILT